MKKTISVFLALMLVSAFCLAFTANAAVEEVTTYWFPWVMDGTEIVQSTVKISDAGIVKELSSNWAIKAQDSQSKITDTYGSPATVWTVDAAKTFELVFEVEGDMLVEVGFLHCVGDNSYTFTVDREGTELYEICKLLWSADGDTWHEVDYDINPAENTLVSGMTGIETVKAFNGDGEAPYSEDYFVISGTMDSTAAYVKFWYDAVSRSNLWDPCIRDAAFTAYNTIADPSSEPDTEESIEEPVTPATGDSRSVAIALVALTTLAAAIVVKKSK